MIRCDRIPRDGVFRHRPASHRLRAWPSGLSLVDLVITVFLMGIAAGIAAPRYARLLDGYRANSAAALIAADINGARLSARQTSRSTSVVFSVPANGYTLSGVGEINRSGMARRVELDTVVPGATLVMSDFDGNASLTFDQFGNPLTGSPLAPLTAGSIIVKAGLQTQSVAVDSVTGKASVP